MTLTNRYILSLLLLVLAASCTKVEKGYYWTYTESSSGAYLDHSALAQDNYHVELLSNDELVLYKNGVEVETMPLEKAILNGDKSKLRFFHWPIARTDFRANYDSYNWFYEDRPNPGEPERTQGTFAGWRVFSSIYPNPDGTIGRTDSTWDTVYISQITDQYPITIEVSGAVEGRFFYSAELETYRGIKIQDDWISYSECHGCDNEMGGGGHSWTRFSGSIVE